MPLAPDQRLALRKRCPLILPGFGLHPTSHLALHEEQSFAALMPLHAVPVGDRLLAMADERIAGLFERLGALLQVA